MKLTSEQKWYTAKSRRRSLLQRANLLALHSVVGSPVNEEKIDDPTWVICNTHNNLYKLHIPRLNENSFTKPAIGKTYLTDRKVISEEDKQAILTDYCTINLYEINFAVDIGDDDKIVLIVLSSTHPKISMYRTKDWLIIEKDDIENFQDKDPIVTTYGRYLCNYFLLASTFCKNEYIDEFKYINDVINIGKIENIITGSLKTNRITTEQVGKYIDYGYFLSSIGDIAGTVATWNSIVPNEGLIARRNELYKKYEGQHNDPRIMAIIENELINQDKEYMRNDPAMDFLGDTEKKFSVHRKRMNVSIGLMEEFGAEKGKYNYISNSLSEGWDKSTFDVLQDDSRKGFYGRAVETQVAGLDTKWMILNFQNNKITADDCKTKRLLTVTPSKETVKSFIGAFVRTGNKHKILQFPNFKEDVRYLEDKDTIVITTSKNNNYKIGDCFSSPWKVVFELIDIKEIQNEVQLTLITTLVVDGYDVITPDNYLNYIDKTIQIRSVMYCDQPDGFCSICAYKVFKDIGLLNIGATAIDLSGVFLNLSMKAMHGTKVDILRLDTFNKYVLNP